ncbi:hypothetical protein GCK32_006531 [Trichostrongylus colubriformis]|uniref:Uncharacterized protein n=1 Tax=Trichostrongylus colubriformis TaxID=6319 RepID=A0AAN8FU92_TRICO
MTTAVEGTIGFFILLLFMDEIAQPSVDPLESTQYLQLEELSKALEKERELVLQTQENYMDLKKKYLDLSEQSQHYQTEMQTLLHGQEQQLEHLFQVSETLKSENEQLREQEQQLRSSLEEMSRKSKLKEEDLRREFSDQIGILIENTAKIDSEDIAQKYGHLKEKELLESDVRVQELLCEIRKIQVNSDEKVQSLKAELCEERQRRIELETVTQRNRLDLEASRELVITKQNELIAIRSELNRRLKECMENEIASLSKEENFRKTLLLRTTSFEKKVAEYERTIEEKDKQIADLRRNLKNMEGQQSTAVLENSLKEDVDEEKRRLECELKKLTLSSKQNEEKNKAMVEQLKQERNKLEITIAELKKNAEAFPSKTAEMNRLRSLLEEKEEQLSASRRRYRQLLRKVETSLIHLEKQHQNTKRKLENNIIGISPLNS